MATVIKAGEAGKVVRRLATVDLADHLREAQSVIAAARSRAVAMVQEARREADAIREASRADGFLVGHEKGLAEGRAEGFEAARGEALTAFAEQQDSLVSALSGVVRALDTQKDDLEIAARRDVLKFAVSVARKLTFAIGSLHRESAQENLRRAFSSIARRTDITIRINSNDRESMEAFAPELVAQMGDSRRVTVEVDDALSPGGCLVQTSNCDVDATLETQTEELVRLLLGTVPGDNARETSEVTSD